MSTVNQSSSSSPLLEQLQALTKVERSLTEAMEAAEPWLPPSSSTSSGKDDSVRPLPSTMEEVHHILAVARNLSGRTSAPVGWNPQAPVVGFATPNPLPHQLRGGALGTLQLERARDSKRKRQEQEQEKKKQDLEAKELAKMEVEQEVVQLQVEDTKEARDPKRREVVQHEMELDLRSQSDISRSIHISQKKQPPKQQVLTADMNLSDDSSSDEESD